MMTISDHLKNQHFYRFLLTILFFILFLFCTQDKWLSEFELNKNTFNEDIFQYIENISGIILPAGAKGCYFYYKPPIDPCFITKIELSQNDIKSLITQLSTFKNLQKISHKNFCVRDWWPEHFDNLIFTRMYYRKNAGYLFSYLVIENKHVFLYLKYITF